MNIENPVFVDHFFPILQITFEMRIIRSRRYIMKCPKCDTDTTGKRKCSKCGLDVAGSQEEIEVEYKDFKTSELLEIRHKKRAVHEHKEINTVREHEEGEAIERASGRGGFSNADKKPFPFLAVLVLLLMLIAGGFFMVRYFSLR